LWRLFRGSASPNLPSSSSASALSVGEEHGVGFARIAIFVVLLGFNHLELAEIQRRGRC
jgi:hypothetical protein